MADNKQKREKRLAEALRENLKRRKGQQRGIDNPETDHEQRLFREKSLIPDKKPNNSIKDDGN